MKKLILIVIGLFLIALATFLFLNDNKYSGKTTGIVVSTTEEKTDKSMYYYPIVKYKVNGKVVEKQSKKATKLYKDGTKVTVYYDKKDIYEFTLDKTPKLKEIIVGLGLMFFGIVFIIEGLIFDEKKDSLIDSILGLLSFFCPGPVSTRLRR